MGLKDFVENHPLSVGLGIVFSTVSIVLPVFQYYSNNEIKNLQQVHTIELKNLESELSSIKRYLISGEGGRYDIRTMYMTDHLPPNSTYHEEDHFYAINMPSWKYSRKTELDFFSDILGKDAFDGLSKPLSMKEGMTYFPMHTWCGGPEMIVKGNSVYQKIYPYITLQVINTEKLKKLISKVVAEDDSESPKETRKEIDEIAKDLNDKKDSDAAEGDKAEENMFILQGLERIVDEDTLIFYLHAVLGSQFDVRMLSDDVHISSNNIQKVGNVLYCSWLEKIDADKIGNGNYKHYYLRREVFMISTPKTLIMITDMIPSVDPSTRGKAFADLARWICNFRIELEKVGS